MCRCKRSSMIERSQVACMFVLVLSACTARVPTYGSDATTAVDAAPTSDGPPGDPSVKQWVLGYYVGYQIDAYPIADIEWSALTHIAFAPVTVNADLTLDLSFDDAHGTGALDAVALATAAHAHGVKVLLGFGGSGTGAAIARAAASSNRTALVQQLLAAVDMFGFDGIDLDWEDSVKLDDLVALARSLRAARPGLVLTYPAGTVNSNIEVVDPRMATLAEPLDRMFVMTYFPATANAGLGWASWFVSPLSGASSATPVAADDSLQRYVAAGIPASKLGLGIGFFAICYTNDIRGPRQATTSSTRIGGGSNAYPLSAFFAVDGTYDRASSTARQRDPVAQEPYLQLPSSVSDPGCGLTTRYISYEDEASIAAKGAFSRMNGYGGTIVWTLQQGYLASPASQGRSRDALIQALGNSFLR